jgi:hypothetical protein
MPRPAQARIAQPAPPPPVVRGQAPEEAVPVRPTRVAIPTPEQLGLAAARSAATADWGSARARLDALGAVCFQLQHSAGGDYCFLVWLPTAEASRTHRIETRADNEADAVRMALEQADRWHAGESPSPRGK